LGKESLHDLREGILTGPVLFTIIDIKKKNDKLFKEITDKYKAKKYFTEDEVKYSNFLL
jgi:geranylgeranyl pyrophosphate synthase